MKTAKINTITKKIKSSVVNKDMVKLALTGSVLLGILPAFAEVQIASGFNSLNGNSYAVVDDQSGSQIDLPEYQYSEEYHSEQKIPLQEEIFQNHLPQNMEIEKSIQVENITDIKKIEAINTTHNADDDNIFTNANSPVNIDNTVDNTIDALPSPAEVLDKTMPRLSDNNAYGSNSNASYHNQGNNSNANSNSSYNNNVNNSNSSYDNNVINSNSNSSNNSNVNSYSNSTNSTNNSITTKLTPSLIKFRNGSEHNIAVDKNTRLVAGDIIEYQTLITNNSNNRLKTMYFDLSIPDKVNFVDKSFPTQSMASLNGHQFYPTPLRTRVNGSIQDIALSKYQALRWKIEDLPAGSSTIIKYRAMVRY